MNAEVPPQVLTWLQNERMEALTVHPLKGRFSASLIALTIKGRSGVQEELICKRVDERSVEGQLYDSLLAEERSLAPKCIGIVPTQRGTALLLERFGISLTEALNELSLPERTALLSKAATKLADMHARLEHNTGSQYAAGKLLTSLEKAAQPWRLKTVEELRGLVQTPDLKDELGDRASLGELIDIAEAWLHNAEKYYAETSSRTTITHGDPHLGNWLVRNKELRLIDWEYAGVSIPQRDLSIFLQDILDDQEQRTVCDVYRDTLGEQGWDVSSEQFKTDFQVHFLDNTLMMLGWDIASYRSGMLNREEFVQMLKLKSNWIQTSASMVL